MAGSSSETLTVRHPFAGLGAFLIVVALVLIAFDLGVLARCGSGEGVCFDIASHRTSDAALVGFFIVFVIGVVLVLYTTAEATVTRTSPASPPPGASGVTVVMPPGSAPAASPPPQTNVTVNPGSHP